MGIVYLVQPCVLVGTNRYKIGRSRKNDLSRLKAYMKGTRYLSIHECSDDALFERHLIDAFNEKYERFAGNEYFIGDEIDMMDTFHHVIKETTKSLMRATETKKQLASYARLQTPTIEQRVQPIVIQVPPPSAQRRGFVISVASLSSSNNESKETEEAERSMSQCKDYPVPSSEDMANQWMNRFGYTPHRYSTRRKR